MLEIEISSVEVMHLFVTVMMVEIYSILIGDGEADIMILIVFIH